MFTVHILLSLPFLFLFCLSLLVPLCSLLSPFVKVQQEPWYQVNRMLGVYEQYILALRFLLFVFLLVTFLNSMSEQMFLVPLLFLGVLLALSFLHFRNVSKRKLAFHTFLQESSLLSPQDFFDVLFSLYGPFDFSFADFPLKYKKLNFDFSDLKGREKIKTLWLQALFSTHLISRLALFFHKRLSQDQFELVVRKLTCEWCLRMLQITHTKLELKGKHLLSNASAFPVYCFNHTSLFDFMIAPLLCAFEEKSLAKLPTFFMAKDHFLENKLIASVLGIGKIASLLGMIFVERNNASISSAMEAVKLGVEKLVKEKRALAIFPQGKRARTQYDAEGKVLGASYYAVGNLARLTKEHAHIKKGAIRIALQASEEIAKEDGADVVSIVPVALSGVAHICPLRSLKLRKGKTVTLEVGSPFFAVTSGPDATVEDIRYLTFCLDHSFISLLGVHKSLERRFYNDMLKICDGAQMEGITVALKEWRGNDHLLYVILDYIYTCDATRWYELLTQLKNLLLDVSTREDLVNFKNQIAEEVARG
ncbi:MAG: hypothetical protein COX62_06770 [Deltaproteobacteria bacterium CG_4_10_14_0_2_um_filter_43_8]|nr:MAG: hypothetical protein COV43_06680 [Deltaproteobacteria bacterium CG11_big_fil_rev_8_21_14_0_20_42_23]PJA19427.1 MAG: hypothetical protein COX62_06770 [Deltaproteobacteria bacterium CG_4_10_14_0_2_um_filter_43_8]PJC64105.1 MAG: hypothetical protein CO021_06020 [Deltaproteobacteria bacterium CG_4_9_14_0_2_um_filter_42_21]